MEGNPENRLSDRKKRITSRSIYWENRELGTLLVQPVKALNFSLTATVDNRKSMAAAGIGIIGGAHNGFGAPLAGIGISVLKDKVEVWKNVDGKVDVLAQSAITVSATTQVRMTVKEDMFWMDFQERSRRRKRLPRHLPIWDRK